MDLLFHKYASPFLLLDGYIRTNRFCEFIDEFMKLHDEDIKWEYFMHKIFDRSWNEFSQTVDEDMMKQEQGKFTESSFETTIQTSMDILSGFNPEK